MEHYDVNEIRIATHDGMFHADELVAISILMEALKSPYNNIQVVRSRDPEILKDCNYNIDVGGEYKNAAGRYDHHQKSFDQCYTFSKEGVRIPLASAGLLWRHHHMGYLRSVMGSIKFNQFSESELIAIYNKITKNIIIPIDANDNGVNQLVLKKVGSPVSNYPWLTRTYLPTWNEDCSAVYDIAFADALQAISEAFRRDVMRVIAEEEAAAVIRRFDPKYVERFETPVYNALILSTGMPWFGVIVEEMPDIDYMIVANHGRYHLQSRPMEIGSMQVRHPLPEYIRGLNGNKLREAAGSDDIEFVHQSGHLAVFKSLEGAKDFLMRLSDMVIVAGM